MSGFVDPSLIILFVYFWTFVMKQLHEYIYRLLLTLVMEIAGFITTCDKCNLQCKFCSYPYWMIMCACSYYKDAGPLCSISRAEI